MRDYQKECIQTIEETFKTSNKQLIQLPTGAGKTWIFAQYLAKNSKKALVICPSIELKEQIIQTCKKFGISSISDNIHKEFQNYVITSSSLTYEKNINLLNKKGFDHIVIDEAHHAQSKTYIQFLKRLDHSYNLLGCTATPERLDGKSLLDIFEKISYSKSIYDLVSDGYLADIKSFRIKTNQKLSKRDKDFRLIELKNLDNDTRNNIIYKCYNDNCKNLKTLIFCLNVNHSERIAQHLKLNGINASCVHGKMSKKSRTKILSKYKTGEISVLTNCQLLTEGFDEPSIEALIIARPTASKSLYCQMIGRGLRKTEQKDICHLYELTDNNHSICTFNVTCGKSPTFQREYKDGQSFLELYKELEKISEEDLFLEKTEINLFANKNALPGNPIDILLSKFYKYPATEYQKFMLNLYEISYQEDINFLEAAFLLWHFNLKEKYGNYKTS